MKAGGEGRGRAPAEGLIAAAARTSPSPTTGWRSSIATADDCARRWRRWRRHRAPATPTRQSLAALGGYLQEAGNLARAAEVLEAARALNPAEMEVYEKLGIAYTRLGRAEQAHAMFAHLLSVAPNSATTLNNLGSLYLSQRRWDEAAEALTRALAIDPTLANAHNGLGVAHAASRATSTGRSPSGGRRWPCGPTSTDARDNIARAEQLKRAVPGGPPLLTLVLLPACSVRLEPSSLPFPLSLFPSL